MRMNQIKGVIVFGAGIMAACVGFYFRLHADDFGDVSIGNNSFQYSPDRVQVFVQLGYAMMGFGLVLLLMVACWWLLAGPLRKSVSSE